MKYTTIVVTRDGTVYDLGDTKREQIVIQTKDGRSKEATLVRPVRYPPTLKCPPGGYIQNPEDIPAFATTVSLELRNKLMKMSKKEVKRFYGMS